MVKLMKGLRVTASSFFIYIRMEPSMFDEILNRVSPESKRVAQRKAHLNQTLSWPERQERSRSVPETPRLAMLKLHSRHGSALVVLRS